MLSFNESKATKIQPDLGNMIFFVGLITIAQSVGVTLLPPRKKITVMLTGNYSAGKSSFINWYIYVL